MGAEICPFLRSGIMFAVNGIEWNLILVEPYSDNLKRSDNTLALGVTDNNTKTIYINNRVSDAMFGKILCHEIVHTFCFSYGCAFDIQTEEIIADFLATYGREVFDVADNILQRFARIA